MSAVFALLLAVVAGAGEEAAPEAAAPAVATAAPATAAPVEASPTPDTPSEYRVGPGDVIDVTVLGNQDLSRSASVQPSGNVALPLLGEVQVAALTVPEIKTKLTNLLARDYLVRPQVEVRVKEYQSQFVTVLGEVNSPGRKPLRGRTRLLDVLLEAGGFTPRASGELVISRLDGTFSGGEKALRIRLGSSAPTAKDQVNLEVPLRNGDLITASQKYYVTVQGEVSRGGRYVLEPDLTVSGAISMAGGLTRYGSTKLKIRRTDPVAATTEILKVDLKAVRSGKEPDVPLQANDEITVGRRLF
jgi:polysaccharide export outer membrane protein